MDKISTKSLKFQIISLSLGIIIATAAMSAILVQKMISTSKDVSIDDFKTKAYALQSSIAAQFYERYGDVQTLALGPTMASLDKNKIVQLLNTYAVMYGIYDLILVLDANGKLIATNDIAPDKKPINTANLYLKSYKEAPWFKAVVEGNFTSDDKNGFSGAYAEDPGLDAIVSQVYGEKRFGSSFSTAIKDKFGKVVGVISNRAGARWFEREFQKSYEALRNSGIVDAELTMVNKDGIVLVDYDPFINSNDISVKHDYDILGKFNLAEENVIAAKELANKKSGSGIFIHGRKNIKQVVGYTPIVDNKFVPSLGWGVIVRASEAAVFKKILAIQKTFYIISSISILLAFFIAYKISMGISKKFQVLSLDLLDNTAIISETDTKGIITYANDLFCNVSGYTKDELIGRPHNIINSKSHSKDFWTNFWNTIKEGKTWKGEVCNVAKNGSLYWLDAIIIPGFGADGKITGYTSVRFDITSKKELEKKMEHREKLASIGEIAAGVGHEINNPLAISMGNLSVIKKTIESENISYARISKAINKMELANDRIKKIVDGLRTYARSDSDHHEIVSLSNIISQTLSLIDEIYRKDGIEIIVDIKNNHLFVNGNIGKLQQVLMNLLGNARDATLNKSERKIYISLSSKDDHDVILSVSDNGTGIQEGIMGKIFNPFFTTKEVGLGTGIGLSMVSEFLKKMNASINVESIMGEGSSFIITFPIVSGTLFAQQQQQQQPLRGNVLVVDDEADISEIISEFLREFGLSVDTANCGDSALLMVEQKRYCYICADIRMPGMDGDEFIKRAKELPNGSNSKYFFISGGVTTGFDKEKRLDLWKLADGFIQKPFTRESLYNVMIKNKVQS